MSIFLASYLYLTLNCKSLKLAYEVKGSAVYPKCKRQDTCAILSSALTCCVQCCSMKHCIVLCISLELEFDVH